MGKHNKPRGINRGGQIAVAAAAATVLAGWAAPVAYADDGADTDTGSNAVSRTAGAVKDAVDSVRKTARDVGSSVRGAARDSMQVGSGGAGSLLRPKSNSPRSTLSAQQTTGDTQRNTVAPALVAPTTPDNATGSVTIPIVDVTLPGLPDGPTFALPTPSPGIPPGFGSQGSNFFGPLGAATNGNNLFGLNFFNIGDNNLLTANNIGTGLQGVVAGDRNFLAGNQVIVPTSFGTNFGWMGDDNGDFDLNLPDSPGDLLNLNPFEILALEPSGNNIVASPFSYGNNTFIMGDGNDGTANNIMLGAGNSGNNMHWIGDNADGAGNNIVTGIGSLGNNMSIIGDNSNESGNNFNLGAFGFANNMGLIGSAATRSGNNTNVSPFGGFAQNFVVVGDGADYSGNNSNVSAFGGFAQNIALIGSGADGSGNNFGIFNFALVGSGVEDAGNNEGGGFNFAIFPNAGQNCTGPACFNFFGAQFGN
ncbi:hypothetical protein [Mycobacterium sp. ITM-2016-00318]|uniref:hypothetical protein n=1 Tax=Mycobacterium sp. ITM-2016-00318 TaxID=2099693 RepID=UPI000CF94C2D|nr:hypothetical protein [Mycobacterium sp. ITM-2016-00318]WNG94772.1 hypothetical protein C6A82_010280 [Mycobacterium sp. ITM-2016-00318]